MDDKKAVNKKRENTGDYSFQVDLKGIIRLLSENLYSSGDVFLRELLQNCVDAVEARRAQEPGFTDGRISISYHLERAENAENTAGKPAQKPGKPVQKQGKPVQKQAKLVFSDNGVGLTREEIHTFLSVIGQSSKRGEMKRGSFIGQFGIGLLSCFLVTDEILVRSRSIHEDRVYCWLGKSDGTYQVTEEDEKGDKMYPGTEVTLYLKGRMASRYGEERVIELLKEYGFLLRIPVEFSGDSGKRRINDGFIPWRQPFCTNEEILQFGELMFNETFFGVVPVSGEGLKGYAFISKRQTSAAAAGRHKIYLKDMLITEDGKDLVPKWAFFTRCILNAENLTPMASREGFVTDHALAKARNVIEQCMFNYFVALSQYDVDKLKEITLIHNVAIKSLAVENEQIYKLFFPFLIFSTNKGNLTGFQIVEAAKRSTVYYCMEVDDYRRARPLAGNGKQVLINAGYIYDTKLLQLLKRYQNGIHVEVFDEAYYGELLEDADAVMKRNLGRFVETVKRALAPLRCGAVLKQFDPPEVPALYVPGADDFLDNAFDEGFWDGGYSGFLEGFDFGSFKKQESGFGLEGDVFGTKLYLNGRNPLLRRLAQMPDGEIMEQMVRVLYVHAMLAGHYSLGERETEILNTGLIKLMEYGLGGNEG